MRTPSTTAGLRQAVLAFPALLLLGALAACGSSSGSASGGGSSSSPGTSPSAGGVTCTYPDAPQGKTGNAAKPPTTPDVHGKVVVALKTTIGIIGATLDAARTPCTVNSFVSLAKQGYFDGSPCHRLTTAQSGIFVLQCGDPTGTGTGGPGYTVPDELTGTETYGAGTLAMANAGPNTGGSQFFIVYRHTQLKPDYTVFGKVDAAGLAAVRKAASAGTDDAFGPGDGHPKVSIRIESVTLR